MERRVSAEFATSSDGGRFRYFPDKVDSWDPSVTGGRRARAAKRDARRAATGLPLRCKGNPRAVVSIADMELPTTTWGVVSWRVHKGSVPI
jgi:hypothetical protein